MRGRTVRSRTVRSRTVGAGSAREWSTAFCQVYLSEFFAGRARSHRDVAGTPQGRARSHKDVADTPQGRACPTAIPYIWD